jgi:CRP-like cAMP-binding protein
MIEPKKSARKESRAPKKEDDDSIAKNKSASKKSKKHLDAAESPRESSEDRKDKDKEKEPKKKDKASAEKSPRDKESKDLKKSARDRAKTTESSKSRPKSMQLPKSPQSVAQKPEDRVAPQSPVPSIEQLRQDAAEISFSVSSSPEPSPTKRPEESNPRSPELPPKPLEPEVHAPATDAPALGGASTEPTTPEKDEAHTETTPSSSVSAIAAAAAAALANADSAHRTEGGNATPTASGSQSARDLTDSSTSDSSSRTATTTSDSLVPSSSVQNMIKKFSASTDGQPQTRSARSSSNAKAPIKPSGSSHHESRRRGSTSSNRSSGHHSSSSTAASSPDKTPAVAAAVAPAPPTPADGVPATVVTPASPEAKKDSHVTISVIRRHSSKDIRHSSLTSDGSRSRTTSGTFTREDSRGEPRSTSTPNVGDDSASSGTLERHSSGPIKRVSSRDFLEGKDPSSPEYTKLKDDMRRYREGYDYYKYKFKEAEQLLAKEGLETFKKEFDEKRKRLREMEDVHKRDQTEIAELKAKVTQLETQIKELKAELANRKLDSSASGSMPHNTSSKELSLSSSSNSLSESGTGTGSRRATSFRGPPISTSSASLLNLPTENKPNTPTSGNTTPTSAAIPTTPQPTQKSKGFKIDLNATLVDLSQYKRTKKPAWALGKGDLDHRTRVALEMLDTEQSYVLGLSVLLENYLKPLVKYCKIEPKIAESDVTKIFADGSLEGIFVLNTKLVEQLEERLSIWHEKEELGDIFDKFAPLLKPYSRYGSRYEECLIHVTELQQKNPKFKKVFDFYDDHAFRFAGLRIKDYMIMPVQRVPRYTMLLRDFLKHTPENHPDFASLQSACKKVEDVASAVNEGIRQAESQTKMAAIIERGGGFEALMKNNRSFIKAGVVPLIVDLTDRKKGGKKDGEILLFNDIVVAGSFVHKKADAFDYSFKFPLVWVSKDLDEEQASAIEQEGFDPATGWTIRSPDATWVIASKDQVDRNNWMTAFADAMSIPIDDVANGPREGNHEFVSRCLYTGEWLDGGFYGKGTYIRPDGVLFDGYWDARLQAGFGTITQSGSQTVCGWRVSKHNLDVEPIVDEFGIFVNSPLTERDWSLLMTGAKEQTYAKGARIISQGQVNSNLYRIKNGTCRVEKTNDAGEKIQLATMGPKTMFGDTAIVPSMKVATADVVADADNVEVFQIEVNICYEILKSNPGLSMRFYKQMALKLSQRLRNLHAPSLQKPAEAKTTKSAKAKKAKAVGAAEAGADSKDAPSAAVTENEIEEKSKDKAFTEKFDLDESEIPIKEYECMSKGVVRKYGTMYITSHHICFEATVFGMSSQEVIKLDRLTATETKNKKELRLAIKNKKWTFIFENGLDEVHSLIENLRPVNVKDRRTTDELGQDDSSSAMTRKGTRRDVNGTVEGITMSKEDWALVQRGFKLVTFNKDEDVVKEGTEMQRIYQIAKGTCRIQITHPTEGPKVVGSMETGALFGEMSFLEGKGATASVIADSETVEMYILEGHFINIVFAANPDLSGRFYAYLASVIAERLNAREKAIAKAAKKSKKQKEKEKTSS